MCFIEPFGEIRSRAYVVFDPTKFVQLTYRLPSDACASPPPMLRQSLTGYRWIFPVAGSIAASRLASVGAVDSSNHTRPSEPTAVSPIVRSAPLNRCSVSTPDVVMFPTLAPATNQML